MSRPNYLMGGAGVTSGGYRSSLHPSWLKSNSSGGTVYTGTEEEKLAQYRADHPDTQIQSSADADLTAAIARMLKSPDKKVRELGQQALDGNINTEVAKALGIETTSTAQQEGDKENKSFLEKVGEKVSPVLEVIGRPQQAVMELIQAAAYDAGLEDHFSPDAVKLNDPGNLSPGAQRIMGDAAGSGGYRDALRALMGKERWDPTSQTYTKNLTLAGAMGQDPQQLGSDWMSRTVNGADFIGSAALDPLNLVGGGGKVAAKEAGEVGARLLAKEGTELTPALTKQLARQGSADITEDALRAALEKTGLRAGTTAAQREEILQALIEKGGSRTTKGLFSDTLRTVEPRGDSWRNPLERAVRVGRETRTGEVRAAENTLNNALRYDRGGIRLLDRSITPEAVRSPVRSALLGKEQLIGRAGPASSVVQAFDAMRESLPETIDKYAARSDEFKAQATALRDAGEDAGKIATAERLSKAFATRADNLQTALNDMDSITTAEEMVARFPQLGDVRAPIRSRTGGLLPDMSAITERLRPREAIRKSLSLPARTDEAIYQAEVLGRSIGSQEQRQFGRILEKAAKDAGTIDETTRMEMLAALDEGGNVADLAATLPENQAKYLQTLDDLRKRTYKTIVDNGLASAEKLRDPENYMGRLFTEEGKKALALAIKRNDPELSPWVKASSLKQETAQGGHLLARQIDPDLPILEFNDKWTKILQEKGYLKPGQDLMETDPATIIAKRQNEAAYALQAVKSIDEMTKIKGVLGDSLVWRQKPGEKSLASAARQRGMQAVNMGEAGVVYAHPEIARELTHYFNVVNTDDGVRGFGQFMDKWNRLWKSYATVPILTGTGFHTKNAIGNMFNNYLAGVSLSAYGEALALQRDVGKAKRAFPELSVPDALAAAGKSEDEIARVELALEHGIIDEGFFSTDLAENPTIDVSRTKGVTKKVTEKISPRQVWNNPSNALGVQTGRKIGEAIEDNARMAHFLSKLDETGDAAQAAMSVKKYLFDYGDLTPFEQKVGKRVHAFYTFTRKNTPLQFAELVRNPAAINRLLMAERAAFGNDPNGTTPMPGFLAEVGRPFGKAQSNALTGGKGNPVVGNLETPFEAAVNTVDPLRSMIPGVKGPSTQDAMQDLFSNVSGGPAELAKAGLEEATGSSVFTGSSLTNPDGTRKINPLVRISQAFTPNVSKGLRLLGSDLAGPQTDSPEFRLIKAMTGLQGKEVTTEMSDRELSQRAQALNDFITSLQAKGQDVPTIEELRAVGEIPKPEQGSSPVTQIKEILLSDASDKEKERQLKTLLALLQIQGYDVPSAESLLGG